MKTSFHHAVARPLAVALVALLTALLSAAVAPVAAQVPRCTTAADIGAFIGWCRCSSLTIQIDLVGPALAASVDPWCKVTHPDTLVHYCDAAGAGNCDLQSAAAVAECTGLTRANGVYPCAVGRVRTMLRYNGLVDAGSTV
ncbi:hypothetical protein MMPV_007867 [Pyropia vietnamensis]